MKKQVCFFSTHHQKMFFTKHLWNQKCFCVHILYFLYHCSAVPLTSFRIPRSLIPPGREDERKKGRGTPSWTRLVQKFGSTIKVSFLPSYNLPSFILPSFHPWIPSLDTFLPLPSTFLPTVLPSCSLLPDPAPIAKNPPAPVYARCRRLQCSATCRAQHGNIRWLEIGGRVLVYVPVEGTFRLSLSPPSLPSFLPSFLPPFLLSFSFHQHAPSLFFSCPYQ